MPVNHDFISFFQDVHRKKARPVKGWPRFFEYARSALRMIELIITDGAVEIIFVVLFGYVIIKMSQGRDLIVSMFEPHGIYGGLRIILTILTLTAFSFSIWMIPAFLFEKKYKWNLHDKTAKDPFETHLFFAHRVMSVVPFWVMAFALFNDSGWWFVLLGVLQLALLLLLYVYVKDPKIHSYFLLAILAALIGFAIYFSSIYQQEYLSAKRALAVMLFLFSTLLYLLYYKADEKIINEHFTGNKKISSIKRYPGNSIFFFSYLLIHLVLLTAIISQSIRIVAPESMLLYVFALYVFVMDVVVYIWRLHPWIQTGGTLVFILVFFLFLRGIFKFNTNHNKIDHVELAAGLQNRPLSTFEEYYNQWKERIVKSDTSKPYPIILVAGEGGGSRAGYWLSQNLIDFDHETGGKFREHIFSLSTVSGSTVGLGTYFAYLEQPLEVKDGQQQVPKTYMELPGLVYKANFVGSSISGLFITDLAHSFYDGGWTEDRNNALMKEESSSTADALGQVNAKMEKQMKCILDREFMSLFYDSITNYKTFTRNRPLAFINTCRSNDGRRGIFSPVCLDENVFNDAIDINGFLYKDNAWQSVYGKAQNTQGISFGQACVASELFPLFSAPVYVDSLGSFVDGGYHENSGLKTTLDIYTKLKSLLKNDADLKGRRYEIYILYLKNGSDEKNLYAFQKPALGITQPVSALISQPFNGSASYFEEKAKYISDTAERTTFIKVPLDNHIIEDNSTDPNDSIPPHVRKEILADLRQKDDSTSLNYPLARWLSQAVIKKMSSYQQKYRSNSNTEIYKLLVRMK